MARRRFYVSQVIDGQAVLRGDEAHHLSRVLRVTAGQQFEIADHNHAYLAEITVVSKQTVTFRVLETLEPGAILPPITLYASLIKFDRFEWLIEKATEIGVARIVPVESMRSDRGLLAAAGKRVDRWRKIARESGQQSRRAAPPEIAEASKLFPAVANARGLRLVAEEQPVNPQLLQTALRQAEHYNLLVGPEGGWHEDERASLCAADWKAVSLGPAILRAETAAIVAAAITAQWWFHLQTLDDIPHHGERGPGEPAEG